MVRLLNFLLILVLFVAISFVAGALSAVHCPFVAKYVGTPACRCCPCDDCRTIFPPCQCDCGCADGRDCACGDKCPCDCGCKEGKGCSCNSPKAKTQGCRKK